MSQVDEGFVRLRMSPLTLTRIARWLVTAKAKRSAPKKDEQGGVRTIMAKHLEITHYTLRVASQALEQFGKGLERVEKVGRGEHALQGGSGASVLVSGGPQHDFAHLFVQDEQLVPCRSDRSVVLAGGRSVLQRRDNRVDEPACRGESALRSAASVQSVTYWSVSNTEPYSRSRHQATASAYLLFSTCDEGRQRSYGRQGGHLRSAHLNAQRYTLSQRADRPPQRVSVELTDDIAERELGAILAIDGQREERVEIKPEKRMR